MKVKILNVNIWEGGRLMTGLCDFITQAQPDIINLQEVWQSAEVGGAEERFNSVAALKPAAGLSYVVFEPASYMVIDGKRVEMGQSTISRWPISQHEIHYLLGEYGEIRQWTSETERAKWVANYPRMLLVSQIATPVGELNVFNMHGVWGTHGDDTPERLEMVRRTLEAIGNKSRVVLSGDFNLNENVYPFSQGQPDLSKPKRTQSVAALEKRLVNVFMDERLTSFNMARKNFDVTGYGIAVVDLFFTTPDINILSHIQPDVDISDHLPQVVEVEID